MTPEQQQAYFAGMMAASAQAQQPKQEKKPEAKKPEGGGSGLLTLFIVAPFLIAMGLGLDLRQRDLPLLQQQVMDQEAPRSSQRFYGGSNEPN